MDLSAEVSIIIPTHNEGPWLKQTVDAVCKTACRPSLEVIVVDDASTDGSGNFLGARPYRKLPIKTLTTAGLGVAGARARGAAEATGDILVFIDAHVLPRRGWLDELVCLLQDASVGIAGVGVRDLARKDLVGHGMTFIDENLTAGWTAPASEPPFEVPFIIGCCFAVRRRRLSAMGGFDPGYRGWGVEDLELGLRAWFHGYRCVVSPKVEVAHLFKETSSRSYNVRWKDYDSNLLRCALTYFSGEPLRAILLGGVRRHSFRRAYMAMRADRAFWQRRRALRSRFRRSQAWFFNRFSQELAQFEARVREIVILNGSEWHMDHQQKRTCPQCGATNLGTQTTCLLCHSQLGPSAPETHPPSKHPTSSKGRTCPNCGSQLDSSKRFCTQCGHPLGAPDFESE